MFKLQARLCFRAMSYIENAMQTMYVRMYKGNVCTCLYQKMDHMSVCLHTLSVSQRICLYCQSLSVLFISFVWVWLLFLLDNSQLSNVEKTREWIPFYVILITNKAIFVTLISCLQVLMLKNLKKEGRGLFLWAKKKKTRKRPRCMFLLSFFCFEPYPL